MTQAGLNEKAILKIEKEYISGPYRWFTYAPDVTGLRLICLEDLETGTVVTTTVANPERRTASHKAWAGARQSRAAGMPWDILSENGAKGCGPGSKDRRDVSRIWSCFGGGYGSSVRRYGQGADALLSGSI